MCDGASGRDGCRQGQGYMTGEGKCWGDVGAMLLDGGKGIRELWELLHDVLYLYPGGFFLDFHPPPHVPTDLQKMHGSRAPCR